jgi:hypothetical protein
MTLTRCSAVIAFAAMLSLQAQTPAPPSPPAPVAGPTMEETVAFINKAYTEQGPISYMQGIRNQPGGLFEDKVPLQSLTIDATCTAGILGYGKPGTGLSIQHMSLKGQDPRFIRVVTLAEEDNEEAAKHGYSSDEISQPEIYLVAAPMSNVEDARLGYFTNKAIADRVAKAYIHVFVLCGGKADPF